MMGRNIFFKIAVALVFVALPLRRIFDLHESLSSANNLVTTDRKPINFTVAVSTGNKKLNHVAGAQNAIVHIGPYKTGSTTLQYLMQKFSAQILADGYSMPFSHIFANGTQVPNPWSNQVQVATCFFDGVPDTTAHEGVVWPCRTDLLEAGQDISERNQSILLSAETFSAFADTGIAALHDYLQPNWLNITIIAFYRRYYKWILSVHGEASKHKSSRNPFAAIRANRTDFLGSTIRGDLSNDALMRDWQRKYVLSSVTRYKKRFANVVVVSMEDLEMSIEEYFFCHAIPNATMTCEAVKKELATNEREMFNKGSQDEIFKELAYQAHRKGLFLIESEDHYHDTLHAMQHYQEKVLNLTASDFPRTLCPPKSILDEIWEVSVQAEEHFGIITENSLEMRKDFDIMSTSKFCDLDYDTVLNSDSWKEFFEKHVTSLISLVRDDPVICEQGYLNMHPDVLRAVQNGNITSGLEHWKLYGSKGGGKPYCRKWYKIESL